MSRVTHFFSSGSCIAFISILMLLTLTQPEARGQTPSQPPNPSQTASPVSIQGSVAVQLIQEKPPEGKPSLEQRSTYSSERSATANEISTWIAGFSLVVSIATLASLRPTLEALRIQSTINGISLIKQRLNVLTGGKWNLSQESLYVPKHETEEEKKNRICSMVDQLCDGSENDRKRQAVERHIRQWLELEACLDKHLKIQT